MSNINNPVDASNERVSAAQAAQLIKQQQAAAAARTAANDPLNKLPTDSAQVSGNPKGVAGSGMPSTSQIQQMARQMGSPAAAGDAAAASDAAAPAGADEAKAKVSDAQAKLDESKRILAADVAKAKELEAQLTALGVDKNLLKGSGAEAVTPEMVAAEAAKQAPNFAAGGTGAQLGGAAPAGDSIPGPTFPGGGTGPTGNGQPTPIPSYDQRLVMAQQQQQMAHVWDQLTMIYAQIRADTANTNLQIWQMTDAQSIAALTCVQTEIFNRQAAVHAGVAAFIKNYISA